MPPSVSLRIDTVAASGQASTISMPHCEKYANKGKNCCLWLCHLCLLDDWRSGQWLLQIGLCVPLTMDQFLLTGSDWRNVQVITAIWNKLSVFTLSTGNIKMLEIE